jgi:hypothetical protein
MKRILIITLILAFGITSFVQRFEPEWAGEVNVLVIGEDTIAVPTEKSIPHIKTSASAGLILFGIGNVRRKAVIKNGRAATQIEPCDTISIIVKCKDNDSDPASFIQIVKFEEKKKERKAELAKENWVGTVTEGNMDFISFKGKKYGTSSYLLSFQAPEGEYGVRVLNPNEEDEKVPIFYCFGLHSPQIKAQKSH